VPRKQRILLPATAVIVFAGALLTIVVERPPPVDARPMAPRCHGVPATIVGTRGNDVGPDDIVGTSGRDVIDGLGGNDVIDGRGGRDLVCGGPGRDFIGGGRGTDLILGAPAATSSLARRATTS